MTHRTHYFYIKETNLENAQCIAENSIEDENLCYEFEDAFEEGSEEFEAVLARFEADKARALELYEAYHKPQSLEPEAISDFYRVVKEAHYMCRFDRNSNVNAYEWDFDCPGITTIDDDDKVDEPKTYILAYDINL